MTAPSTDQPRPSLFVRMRGACPRCDSRDVRHLPGVAGSAFDWHECGDCSYLWALPEEMGARATAVRA